LRTVLRLGGSTESFNDLFEFIKLIMVVVRIKRNIANLITTGNLNKHSKYIDIRYRFICDYNESRYISTY